MLTVRSVSFGIGKTANTRDVHLELKMAGAVDLIGEVQMTGYQVQAFVLDIFHEERHLLAGVFATGINVEDELVSMGRREGHVSAGKSGN